MNNYWLRWNMLPVDILATDLPASYSMCFNCQKNTFIYEELRATACLNSRAQQQQSSDITLIQ